MATSTVTGDWRGVRGASSRLATASQAGRQALAWAWCNRVNLILLRSFVRAGVPLENQPVIVCSPVVVDRDVEKKKRNSLHAEAMQADLMGATP